MEEPSETPSDDPPPDDYQNPLLAMVHNTLSNTLSQPAILDSSDIAQLLSVSKSTKTKSTPNVLLRFKDNMSLPEPTKQ